MLPGLLQKAFEFGYEITLGDAYRDPRVTYGHPNSLHRSRLAIDLNLFHNGAYITDDTGHKELGAFWESIGGTWGGRFKGAACDPNHYSLGYGGMK